MVDLSSSIDPKLRHKVIVPIKEIPLSPLEVEEQKEEVESKVAMVEVAVVVVVAMIIAAMVTMKMAVAEAVAVQIKDSNSTGRSKSSRTKGNHVSRLLDRRQHQRQRQLQEVRHRSTTPTHHIQPLQMVVKRHISSKELRHDSSPTTPTSNLLPSITIQDRCKVNSSTIKERDTMMTMVQMHITLLRKGVSMRSISHRRNGVILTTMMNTMDSNRAISISITDSRSNRIPITTCHTASKKVCTRQDQGIRSSSHGSSEINHNRKNVKVVEVARSITTIVIIKVVHLANVISKSPDTRSLATRSLVTRSLATRSLATRSLATKSLATRSLATKRPATRSLATRSLATKRPIIKPLVRISPHATNSNNSKIRVETNSTVNTRSTNGKSNVVSMTKIITTVGSSRTRETEVTRSRRKQTTSRLPPREVHQMPCRQPIVFTVRNLSERNFRQKLKMATKEAQTQSSTSSRCRSSIITRLRPLLPSLGTTVSQMILV